MSFRTEDVSFRTEDVSPNLSGYHFTEAGRPLVNLSGDHFTEAGLPLVDLSGDPLTEAAHPPAPTKTSVPGIIVSLRDITAPAGFPRAAVTVSARRPSNDIYI